MQLDGRALPLTRGQLDIWLAQKTGRFGAKWQLGELLRIDGAVDPDLLQQSIVYVLREAEPLRASFFEMDGRVFQKLVDYPDVEVARYNIIGARDPAKDTYRLASSIQRTLMPLDGPLFKFALFQTRAEEFYLFACCHHIVVDGIALTFVCHRIANVYSALAAGEPIPAALFGPLRDLIDCELEYEASGDYIDDQAYWRRNLPPETEPNYRPAHSTVDGDDEASEPVQLDSSFVAGVQALSQTLGVRRSSVITAACALLVRAFDTESPEVVLDFPVSRRVDPRTQTVPGMVSGFLPLVLKASPESQVASFCKVVDSRMREALKHQRFPVHAIDDKTRLGGSGQASNRVAVNIIPATHTGHFAGAPTTGTLTHAGPLHFGLVFFRDEDQLFLTTVGDGQFFSNCDVRDLAERLERLLAAMTADPRRLLSSIGVLDAGEHARLDAFGNRAVLGRAGTGVSIPAVFAAQVARTPEAVAVVCAEDSMTYRELDEASNRVAHVLAGRGAVPGQYVALVFSRSTEAVTAILAVLKTGAAY
ncbi:condensation domain-containing protein, partial [Mycobacterium sp. 852002-51971_SCH5477799-a]|uniref:condensation domain-containing protein n=1 Tax=Mycobacterium sp. 852002-51971_SCH5477799-a TaxID=1834106 RepID=UPI000A462854